MVNTTMTASLVRQLIGSLLVRLNVPMVLLILLVFKIRFQGGYNSYDNNRDTNDEDRPVHFRFPL